MLSVLRKKLYSVVFMMSIGDFGQWLVETYNRKFPPPQSEKLDSTWKFCDFFQFEDTNLPFRLAEESGQQIINFGNGIYGIILPYDHVFDGEFYIPMPHKIFLHLFNTREYGIQDVSGMVNEVKFTERIHPKHRLVLSLNVK